MDSELSPQPIPGPVEILGPSRRLDHLPVIAQALKRLRVAEIINERVPPHPDREISVGACVEAMILTILQGSHALYRVSEQLEPYDLGLLFGDELVAADFNDNRLGRGLDQLFKAGLSSLYTAAMFAAIEAYELDHQMVHHDITQLQVHGRYASSRPSEATDPDAAPHVTYGYAKKARSDLKQALYGLTVSNDGYVPLLGHVTDGNRNENVENRFNLTRLAEVMPDPRKVTVVADTKLFCAENLELARREGLQVLTLMPRNVLAWQAAFDQVKGDLKQAPVLRERLRIDEIEDEDSGEIHRVERVEATWRGRSVSVVHYWKEEKGAPPKEIKLRALVVHSTELEASKRAQGERLLDKERRALAAIDKRFAKPGCVFDCEADAGKAAREALAKRQQFHASQVRVVAEEQRVSRGRSGRPRKGEVAPTKTVFRVSFEHRFHPERLAAWIERESSFVLVTLPESEASDTAMLEGYKGQAGVEGAFRTLKGPLEVTPIFLDTPKRIAALGFVYVVALQVYTLVQRELKRRLAEEKTTIPGNRGRTARPTAEVMFRLLAGITSLPVRTLDGRELWLIEQITTEQVAVFDLLGVKLLEREDVVARVVTPGRGQRGYKPPPDTSIRRKRRRLRSTMKKAYRSNTDSG